MAFYQSNAAASPPCSQHVKLETRKRVDNTYGGEASPDATKWEIHRDPRRSHTTGFLGGRESEARHSRITLVRAGDIEPNPGPGWQCGWCKEPVQSNHLSCIVCGTKFHKKRFCSGLSRDEARRIEVENSLTCFNCTNRTWRKCGKCAKELRSTLRGATCSRCGKIYHYECAKIPRSQRANLTNWVCECEGESIPHTPEELNSAFCLPCRGRIRRGARRRKCDGCSNEAHLKCAGTVWNCGRCGELPVTAEDPLLPSSRCIDCRGKVNKGMPRAVCIQCNKTYHFNCTSSTRSGQQLARKPAWKCDTCKEATKESRQARPEASGLQTSIKRARNGLRILQWNCNGLHSKSDELSLFLNEHHIDVACIQETKMATTDKTPKFRGLLPNQQA